MRSTIGDPDLRSPSGFDSGLRPPLRMTRGAGKRGTEVCVLGVRRSRPAVALWVRLRASPSAQDDTVGKVWQRKSEFTLDYRRNFFSFKLIKKPSPVGEGGPRQWWMRSWEWVCALDVWRSRPAVALRVRLRASPSAQDDTEAEMFDQSLVLRWITGVIFLASRQIKKPSPVGEGGPR